MITRRETKEEKIYAYRYIYVTHRGRYYTLRNKTEREREKNKYHCAKTKITKNAMRDREYVVGDLFDDWKTNFMRFRKF